MNTDNVMRTLKGDPIIDPKGGDVGYKSGKRYTFDTIFGWITDEERSELRQKDPRIAP